MLFSATSTDNTHTTEEHSAKVRSESRGSIVICGQRLTYLPCAKKAEKKERKKRKNKIMVPMFFCQAIKFVPKNNSHFEIQFH